MRRIYDALFVIAVVILLLALASVSRGQGLDPDEILMGAPTPTPTIEELMRVVADRYLDERGAELRFVVELTP